MAFTLKMPSVSDFITGVCWGCSNALDGDGAMSGVGYNEKVVCMKTCVCWISTSTASSWSANAGRSPHTKEQELRCTLVMLAFSKNDTVYVLDALGKPFARFHFTALGDRFDARKSES
jgi:hypothetical protein